MGKDFKDLNVEDFIKETWSLSFTLAYKKDGQVIRDHCNAMIRKYRELQEEERERYANIPEQSAVCCDAVASSKQS